jgi:hypothetical protein
MRRAALFLLVVALAGCERGCLARWLSGDGEGTYAGGSSPTTPRDHAIDLSGTDCSDGLLRCQHGQVEASRTGHLSARCGEGQSPEKKASECVCPWEVLTSCTCAIEGVEISAMPDAGARQLCRPVEPVARPVLASDDASVTVCADEGTTCREGLVRVCDAPAAVSRTVAYCIFGCAAGVELVETEDGPAANLAGVISILCRHSDAERR